MINKFIISKILQKVFLYKRKINKSYFFLIFIFLFLILIIIINIKDDFDTKLEIRSAIIYQENSSGLLQNEPLQKPGFIIYKLQKKSFYSKDTINKCGFDFLSAEEIIKKINPKIIEHLNVIELKINDNDFVTSEICLKHILLDIKSDDRLTFDHLKSVSKTEAFKKLYFIESSLVSPVSSTMNLAIKKRLILVMGFLILSFLLFLNFKFYSFSKKKE